jgi:hypothetical protein
MAIPHARNDAKPLSSPQLRDVPRIGAQLIPLHALDDISQRGACRARQAGFLALSTGELSNRKFPDRFRMMP